MKVLIAMWLFAAAILAAASPSVKRGRYHGEEECDECSNGYDNGYDNGCDDYSDYSDYNDYASFDDYDDADIFDHIRDYDNYDDSNGNDDNVRDCDSYDTANDSANDYTSYNNDGKCTPGTYQCSVNRETGNASWSTCDVDGTWKWSGDCAPDWVCKMDERVGAPHCLPLGFDGGF